MTLSFDSFADYQQAIATLPRANDEAITAAQTRQGQLTKPPGSLGRLEEIAIWMAGWQGVEKPVINHPACLIFAGNHGVAALGVSAFPPEVTVQMVANFAAGGAAINQLTKAAGASLDVIALDLDYPTQDFTQGAAMSEAEVLDAMAKGAAAIPDDADMLMLGEMGIGNTTAAAAVSMACLGGVSSDWVGRGTGVDDQGLALKADVVNRGMTANGDRINHGFGILSAFAGREMAAIAGAVLAARHRRIPVLLDGFISTASALPLFKDNPAALDHILVSHRSQESGHANILDAINKAPILDLGLRLGEGSGAATALPIVKSALAAHNGMATFAEAGVSGAN